MRRIGAWSAALLAGLASLILLPQAPFASPDGPAPDAEADLRAARLGFIESLYRERDDFRAESEMLAFLFDAPGDPRRPEVELARAKLYFRADRLSDADTMLISLLDRNPRGPVAEDARRLLGFTLLRQGRTSEAQPLLAGEPDLAVLLEPPPYSPDRAVAWSTALPGSGFFALDEPGKAVTAVGVNLLLLAGSLISYDQHNVPVALLFLAAEAAFYGGGRDAVREEAQRLDERWLNERREGWLARSSERKIMATAFATRF